MISADMVGTLFGASISLATFGAGMTAKALWSYTSKIRKNDNGKHCSEHEKLVVITTEIRTIVKGLAEKDVREHDEIFERLRKAENRVSVLSDREQISD